MYILLKLVMRERTMACVGLEGRSRGFLRWRKGRTIKDGSETEEAERGSIPTHPESRPPDNPLTIVKIVVPLCNSSRGGLLTSTFKFHPQCPGALLRSPQLLTLNGQGRVSCWRKIHSPWRVCISTSPVLGLVEGDE